MILKEGERLDDLEFKGLKIIQREGCYHFTSDSVLLANSVKVRKGAKVLDMGTGSGIIAIIIAAKSDAHVTGIELQESLYDTAIRSVEYNGLTDKVEILNMDILDAPEKLGAGVFDTVVVNPPYGKTGAGEMSGSEHIDICRRELKITLNEIITAGGKLLKFGGTFYMVHKADRLAEAVGNMLAASLTPKRLITVFPRAGKPADSFIIECKKGAAHGMRVEALTVYNEDNTYTREAAALYNKEQL